MRSRAVIPAPGLFLPVLTGVGLPGRPILGHPRPPQAHAQTSRLLGRLRRRLIDGRLLWANPRLPRLGVPGPHKGCPGSPHARRTGHARTRPGHRLPAALPGADRQPRQPSRHGPALHRGRWWPPTASRPRPPAAAPPLSAPSKPRASASWWPRPGRAPGAWSGSSRTASARRATAPSAGRLAAGGVADLAGGGRGAGPPLPMAVAPRPRGGQRDETPRLDYPATLRFTQSPLPCLRDSVLPTTNPSAAGGVSTMSGPGQGSAYPLRCRAGTPTAFGGPARPGRSVQAGRVPPRTLRGQGSLRAHECSLGLRPPLDRSRPGAAQRQRQPRVGLSPSGNARPARPPALHNSTADGRHQGQDHQLDGQVRPHTHSPGRTRHPSHPAHRGGDARCSVSRRDRGG
jgi:hypothetical protein